MNQTYSSSNSGKSNRKRIQSPENFLEALRDLGRSAIEDAASQIQNAVTRDIPESFGLPQSGTLNPNESFSMRDIDLAEKKAYKRAETGFSRELAQMRQLERNRLLQEEATAKKQIQTIRDEIAGLAKSMGDFAQEIQIATLQAPTNPGIYHKNFYAHLRSVIKSIRTRVETSKNWLATSNARASKRNFYWSQVGKSGTKFMLSSERYMVTSTG